MCQSQPPSSSYPLFPPWYPYIYPLCLCLYFWFANKVIHTVFLGFHINALMGFPGGNESACQCRRCKRLRFDFWVGKIPWRRKRQPAPVFLPGKFHAQGSLVGYSPWGCQESDTTRLSDWAQEHRFALQRCISFYSAVRWISYKYTYIPSLLNLLSVPPFHPSRSSPC